MAGPEDAVLGVVRQPCPSQGHVTGAPLWPLRWPLGAEPFRVLADAPHTEEGVSSFASAPPGQPQHVLRTLISSPKRYSGVGPKAVLPAGAGRPGSEQDPGSQACPVPQAHAPPGPTGDPGPPDAQRLITVDHKVGSGSLVPLKLSPAIASRGACADGSLPGGNHLA